MALVRGTQYSSTESDASSGHQGGVCSTFTSERLASQNGKEVASPHRCVPRKMFLRPKTFPFPLVSLQQDVSLNALPLPCVYITLPWPNEQPYCRFVIYPPLPPTEKPLEEQLTSVTTAYAQHARTSGCAELLKTLCFYEVPAPSWSQNSKVPHQQLVEHMFLEKHRTSPPTFVIRYAFAQDMSKQATPLNQDDAARLFKTSERIFPVSLLSKLSLKIAKGYVKPLRRDAKNKNYVAYIRARFADLPLSLLQVQQICGKQLSQVPLDVTALAFIVDFRFSLIPRLWNLHDTRRMVHFALQLQLLLEPFFNQFHVTVFVLPPARFSSFVQGLLNATDSDTGCAEKRLALLATPELLHEEKMLLQQNVGRSRSQFKRCSSLPNRLPSWATTKNPIIPPTQFSSCSYPKQDRWKRWRRKHNENYRAFSTSCLATACSSSGRNLTTSVKQPLASFEERNKTSSEDDWSTLSEQAEVPTVRRAEALHSPSCPVGMVLLPERKRASLSVATKFTSFFCGGCDVWNTPSRNNRRVTALAPWIPNGPMPRSYPLTHEIPCSAASEHIPLAAPTPQQVRRSPPSGECAAVDDHYCSKKGDASLNVISKRIICDNEALQKNGKIPKHNGVSQNAIHAFVDIKRNSSQDRESSKGDYLEKSFFDPTLKDTDNNGLITDRTQTSQFSVVSLGYPTTKRLHSKY